MSSDDHSNDRIDDIEREIDQDRSHLRQTISALEDKLSPGQIFDQVWSYARRNGGTFSDNLVQTVSNNPVPVIMTAVGVAWMALARNRDDYREDAWYREGSDFASDYPSDYPARASYGVDPAYDDAFEDEFDPLYGDDAFRDSEFGSVTSTRSSPASASSPSTTDKTGQKIKDMKADLGGKARSAKAGASESLHRAGDKARHLSDDARRSARQVRERSRRQWQHASHGARDFFETNPLAIGAAALAVGALIGAALPETDAEKRLLGEKGEKLTDKAKALMESSVNDLAQAGKAGAQAAKENLRSSSTLQGRA